MREVLGTWNGINEGHSMREVEGTLNGGRAGNIEWGKSREH